MKHKTTAKFTAEGKGGRRERERVFQCIYDNVKQATSRAEKSSLLQPHKGHPALLKRKRNANMISTVMCSTLPEVVRSSKDSNTRFGFL